jgi:hypothetical protein
MSCSYGTILKAVFDVAQFWESVFRRYDFPVMIGAHDHDTEPGGFGEISVR